MALALMIPLTSSVTGAAKPVDLVLADQGKTTYVIALAGDAAPAEQTAARELSDYLQKMSGAQFAIKNETAVKPGDAQILVGVGRRVKHLLPQQKWDSLGRDGIVIRTIGQQLILAGGTPRGTRYAVDSFLQDEMGVRWWTPEAEFVPQKSRIVVAPQNLTYVPQLQTREAFYSSVQTDPVFAVRQKNNGQNQNLGPELGGNNSILGFVHTFDKLLPPEKYFKDHPEWYSDPNNDGQPCTAQSAMPAPQTSQISLTNTAARLELTKNALAWIRKNPEAGMISISQNDNYVRHKAPADLAIEEREGSPAGPLLEFVNAVAADIEKEYPGFLVETLAYLYTRKAPRHVRPRANVVIRLCSIEADFARPIDSQANASFRDDVLAWKAIAPRLFIWDYTTNFSNVILPHPNLRVLGSNIRFFVANNAIGLFEQGDAYSNNTGDFVAMRTWLISQLMWKPHLDQTKLENEFLHGYYGAAAPHLRAYLDGIQDAFLKSGGNLWTFQSDYSYLTLDVMNQATRQFKNAEAAVAGDAKLLSRVRRERMALDHAWLLRYRALQHEATLPGKVFEGPADPAAFAARFIDDARLFKVNHRSETESFETYAPKLLARFAPAAPLPELARGRAPSDVIDSQEDEFNFPAPALVKIIDDTKASNGRAASMEGNRPDWLIQYPLTLSDELLQGRWRCYIYVRVTAKEGTAPGVALSAGLYDVKNKIETAAVPKTMEEMKDGEYHAVDLGVHELHNGMYFWVAPPARADVESVNVDRVVLVRERD